MPKKHARSRSKPKAFLTRNLHYILLFVLALLILAALMVGEGFNAYEAIWWWDDMLHTLFGLVLGLIGLLAIYFLNAKHTMAINPWLVAVFAFCFAVTLSALWEILEFTFDVLFHTQMQRWNLPADATLIGRDYQGVGLRDTMSDLIVATIGASVSAVISFLVYMHKRPTVLFVMRKAFPWIRRQSKAK